MNPYVGFCWSVGWLVVRSVGLSVTILLEEGGKLHFHAAPMEQLFYSKHFALVYSLSTHWCSLNIVFFPYRASAAAALVFDLPFCAPSLKSGVHTLTPREN